MSMLIIGQLISLSNGISYVELPITFSSQSYAEDVWIYFSTPLPSAGSPTISLFKYSDDLSKVELLPDKVSFITSSGGSIEQNFTLTLGHWHHIAILYDNKVQEKYTLFLDFVDHALPTLIHLLVIIYIYIYIL